MNTLELYHHGVKGMKWGVRRYQNKDGSLTESGKKRLAKSIKKQYPKKSTSEARSSFMRDLTDDLSNNYESQLKSHLNNIREKRKIYEEAYKIESSYFGSKEHMQDGYEDEIITKGKERYLSNKGYAPEIANKAYGDYTKACRSAASDVIGKYGNMKIPKSGYANDNVHRVVQYAIEEMSERDDRN